MWQLPNARTKHAEARDVSFPISPDLAHVRVPHASLWRGGLRAPCAAAAVCGAQVEEPSMQRPPPAGLHGPAARRGDAAVLLP